VVSPLRQLILLLLLSLPVSAQILTPTNGGTGVNNFSFSGTQHKVASAGFSTPASNKCLEVDSSGNLQVTLTACSTTSGTVTSFSAGNLSPLFTTSVATATSTPALTFALSNAAAHTVFGNLTGSTAAPAFTSDSTTINTTAPLGGGTTFHLGDTITITCTGCSTTTGTVTSIATTSPITGGTITTTGTIACATCVTATTPGIGIAHFAGGTQAVTSSAVDLSGADVTNQLPIGNVGSSGLSGTSPITISAAGAIACATCNTTASNVTSVFTRTGAVVAASGDYSLDKIGNPLASASFTAPATNTYSFLGTAPASVSTAGTAAGTHLTVTAPAGGATTGSATTGGTGGDIAIATGAGGSGSGGTNANGGRGGILTFTGAAGGTQSGSGVAGTNGYARFTGGNGVVIGAIGGGFVNPGNTDLYVNRGSNVGKIFLGYGSTAVGANFSTDGTGIAQLTSNSGGILSVSGSTGTVTMSKTLASYNGIATVSNGVPSEYATVDLTGQTAAKTTTTLYAVPAAGVGMYRVSVYAKVTTAGSISSVLGGTNGFQIGFTDSTDSVAQTVTVLDLTNTALNTNNTTTVYMGSAAFMAKASTNITYAFDYTSAGTAMAYTLHIKLEAM
jgi:hypothetical protein